MGNGPGHRTHTTAKSQRLYSYLGQNKRTQIYISIYVLTWVFKIKFCNPKNGVVEAG